MAWTNPKTFTANSVLTASELNTHLRENLKAATEWTSYTVTWAATGGTPSIGNGTLTGRYIAAGNLCHFSIRLTFGSTTSVGTTTAWTFSLPVTAQGAALFPAQAFDNGVGVRNGLAGVIASGTVIAPVLDNSGTSWGYATPFTWTTGDAVTVSGTYEI